MKNIYIISSLILSLSAASQVTPKKASNYYDSYSYSKVIEKLEGKTDITTDAQRKLAESYKMTANYVAAELTYAKIVSADDKKAEDLYAYAQLLKMNGKYDQAKQQMEAYASTTKNDSRVKLFNQDKNYAAALLKDKGQFEIKDLALNTDAQDFGVTYYNDEVIYTSSSQDINVSYRLWNGNNLPYLDLNIGKLNDNNEIIYSRKLSALNKKYHEGPASYSKDGSILIYTQDNYDETSSDDTRKLEMMESTFKDGKWGEKIPFPLNNKEFSVGHPSLTPDGNTLYFSSDMPGGKGGVDIYKITRHTDGTWGKAENLGDKINTEGNEMFPFIHESGLFFFSSDGRPGLGGLDVFATQIKGTQFSKVVNVGTPINGTKDDFTFILNKDQTKGFFASNREGGKGDDDLYSFNLLKPFKFGKTIRGTAKDKQGTLLANVKVNLYDPDGRVINTITTDETGTYDFDVENNGTYKLNGHKEKYFDGNAHPVITDETQVVISDVILDKDPGLSLLAIVTDAKTDSVLVGVKIKMTDIKTGEVFIQELTSDSGDVFKPLLEKKLNDLLSYKIELSKEGYFPKEVTFNYFIKKPGIVYVHRTLKRGLSMDKEVKDLRSLVVINNIRFDLDKSNIRPDAALELDKIVEIMNTYPELVVELGAHTDCRASKKYNETLSDKRAKASAAYIKSKISKPERIFGKGYGESKLLNGCACEGTVVSDCSEEEHQKNRRTEFKVISFEAKNVDIKNNGTNSFDKK